MPITHLVATRPPLNEQADAAALAPLIGQGAYEAKLFLKYGMPEIVGAAGDAATAESIASRFRAAGVAVEVVPLDLVARLSPAPVVRSFGFTPVAAVFVFAEGDATVPWSEMRRGVTWSYASSGKADDAPSRGPGPVGAGAMSMAAEAGGDRLQKANRGMAYDRRRADLYFVRDGAPARVRLDQAVLECSGLGEKQRSESLLNWQALLDEIRARVPKLTVDDSLLRAKIRSATLDAKFVEPGQAREFEPVRKLLPEFSEFYSVFSGVALSGTPAVWPAKGVGSPYAVPPKTFDVAAAVAASAAPAVVGCPICEGEAGRGTVTVEAWKDLGVTLTMKRKYQVWKRDVSGICATCVSRIRRGRWAASVMAAAPLTLAGGMLPAGNGGGFFIGAFFAFSYAMYLLKWGDYTWADRSTYGFEVERKLGSLVQPPDGSVPDVNVPAGCLWLLVRLGFGGAFILLGALIGAIVSR